MIVVFRRIRAAAGRVTGTEWVLVFVEGLLVFLGIVAAFQLEQWADTRRETKARHDLMERLTVEAEANVRLLRNESAHYEEVTRSVSDLIDRWLKDGQCPTDEIVLISQIPTLRDETVVYDEMIGAGGLSLLPDNNVREAIADYHSMRQFYVGQQALMRDFQAQNPLVDSLVDIGFRSGVNADGDIEILLPQEGRCDDPRATTKIMVVAAAFTRLQEWRATLANRAIRKCAVLADRVGRDCVPDPERPLEGEDLEIAREALEKAS